MFQISRLPFEVIEFENLKQAEEYYKNEDLYRANCNELYTKYNIIQNGNIHTIKNRVVPKDYSHVFLTINPPPTLELNDFLNLIAKTLSKKWIESHLYVIEQRGENMDELGKGMHAHLLMKLTKHKKRSEIDREVKNTWKHILDSDNYHILNIKCIDDDEQKRKQSYILGTKSEEAKHLKQKMDIEYRKFFKLQKYYNLHYNIEPELK